MGGRRTFATVWSAGVVNSRGAAPPPDGSPVLLIPEMEFRGRFYLHYNFALQTTIVISRNDSVNKVERSAYRPRLAVPGASHPRYQRA